MQKQEQTVSDETILVYIGTYTGGDSEGIYICQLDMATGALQLRGVAGNVENPSYLALDTERLRLYAVNEVSDYKGQPGGSASAFAIDAPSGQLSLINQVFSHGEAPCYVTLDQTGRYLFLVNYSGGNAVVLPIDEGGGLGEPSDIIAHAGSSVHPERQGGPHPHSIVLDPANQYAFVPDLGLDRVMQYRLDQSRGRLFANERPWVGVRAGSGPRHMVFHPNGEFAYVVNELSSTIDVYQYDQERGVLGVLQTITTLPEGFHEANTAADLHLTPNGKLLFASNRGHNSIACYFVNPESGELTPVSHVPTQGETPRGFAVDPGGTYVLVANQDSHTVVTFRIDEDSGTIFPTGSTLHIPSPVCVKVARIGGSMNVAK